MPALAFEPARPVEFVVTSGPGGGTDNFARTVQSIISKHKLMDASIVVTNKGGGSGAEGFVYAAGHKGDPYKLTFGTNNEYLLPSVAAVPYKPEDLTPVAALALDEFLVWVNGESKVNDIKAFVAAAKAEPKAIQFGGSQSKDTDQILVSTIADDHWSGVSLHSVQEWRRGSRPTGRGSHRRQCEQSQRESRSMAGGHGKAVMRLPAGPLPEKRAGP